MLTTASYKRIFCFLWVALFVFSGVSYAASVKSYSYDDYGNVQAITDPRGFVTQYYYDILNRLERIDYPSNRSVNYSYDLSGIRTKMRDHRGETLFEPDQFGRITKVTFPDGQTVSYGYDSEGNLVKLVYPDGNVVAYTYDLSNRLDSVKDSSGVTKCEYDELSNALRKKTLPNGITTEYRYDQTRKIAHVIHKKADGTLIEEFRYAYDENGNRTEIEKISLETFSNVTYAYDKLNRVIKAGYSDGFFEEFSYDGAGNRLSKTTPQGKTVYEYDEENRLCKAGDTVYVYDPAGNLIEKSSPERKAVYKYDFDNRLVFYSDASNQVAFEYDGNGNRISKTVNGVRTEYINDLVAPVTQVLVKKVQGSWRQEEKTTHYTYGGSRISQSASGKTQFYLYDSIGRNVSALISSSGGVLNTYDYDAFGCSLSEEQDISNAYKYCGEQFDEETGLIFLRNRYYDPETGRFISKDPRPGKLERPATLNPYCYVENNPVNFVDPWGLEAIEPEVLELVIVHVNGLPGWFGGQGIGGHVFMEFPARKDTTPYFGNYPEGPTLNEEGNTHPKTVSVAGYCNSEKVDAAIKAMNNINWTCTKNCVHTVVEGMKIMEFPLVEQVHLSSLPIPLELQAQMLQLHERDPVRPLAYPHEEEHSPSKTSSRFGLNHSPSDFGGVSLSKTAELRSSLADIAGVAFDPTTGQLILFGPENHYLPSIDLDDLAVAVRSVYGIGLAHPQDPGVSIGTEPCALQGYMQVRYDGATANTAFGQVLFEADRLLKCLELGKDNVTGQPISVDVPGYASLLSRMAAYQQMGPISYRMWFVPDQITLIEAEDHKGMVFNDVRMKVLTESQLNGSSSDPLAAREFAEHFTVHFDEFAKQFPVLDKLKTLGKITAITKWIKENNIPFDLSFFLNYQPKAMETAQYTASTEGQIKREFMRKEKRKVPGHKHKKKVPVPDSQTFTLTGGVDYTLHDKNFAMYVDPVAGDFTASALQSRPSEHDFTWSFQSPANQEMFTAVAQSIYRTKKPGNVKKSYTDLNIPVLGAQKLSLQRFYNSFSQKESPLGVGWRILPYELELPAQKMCGVTQDGRTFQAHAMILVRTPEGEEFYPLCALSEQNLPLFKSPINPNVLQDNLDGTFTLVLPRKGQIDFDAQGRLLKILDTEGYATTYVFQDHLLTTIYHHSGAEIQLEYAGARLIKALGPDNHSVQYAYHDDGQLALVGDVSKTYFHYFYDGDQRLSAIIDPLGNTLFEASYDSYNRATCVKEGSMSYRSDFSLEKKQMTVTEPQGHTLTVQFDEQDRLIRKQSSAGLAWEFSYAQEGCKFPTKILDSKGGVTECRYDASGNLIYFKNPVGAEWRFLFDQHGNLIGQKEPNGRAIRNGYTGKNRLTESCLKAFLAIDANNPFALTPEGLKDDRYAVHFFYDVQTGQLLSRTNTRGAKTSWTYDPQGQQTGTLYPTGYTVERTVDSKGRMLAINDGFGLQKSYTYDAHDRIKAIQTPAGSSHFTYDDRGHLTQIVDPKGFATSYDYNNLSYLRQVTDAEGSCTAYAYNSTHQLSQIVLSNGTCKTMHYDALGRLAQEIWGKN